MQLEFHHVGLACDDIAQVLAFLQNNGMLNCHGTVQHDSLQEADLCWAELNGGPAIELISGPIVAGLVKKGIFLYHSCWQTDDLDACIADLQSQGALLISAAKPAVLFDGRRVAFMSTAAGLFELLESGCLPAD